MRGNYFICGNEVFIEGVSVGNFESIEVQEDRDYFGATCTLMLPMYAIGFEGSNRNLPTEERLRAVLAEIMVKTGARVRVECWYYDNPTLEQSFERIVVFEGFIRQVVGGFPCKLLCDDNAFVMKFGRVDKNWPTRSSLKNMVEYIAPIANDACGQFRKAQGFEKWGDFPHISFDSENSGETDFALQVSGSVSPYAIFSKLLKMYNLYSVVNSSGSMYFGIGVSGKSRNTIELNTSQNVIDRDITSKDGLFENYYVEVNGYDMQGRAIKATRGDSEGESVRRYSSLRTENGIDELAESTFQYLLSMRNKGTVQTILYPEIKLFDYVKYTDTLFPELSGSYYVIGRTFTGGKNGYIQRVEITDEKYIL